MSKNGAHDEKTSNTLQAREVVIIITGAHKALALQKTIECGVNHMWTLSSLQMHPYAMIVVDEDATLELQVKTVKVEFLLQRFSRTHTDLPQYFKSIEQVAASQGFGQSLASAELTLKKRDSVLEKLDSPKSATSKNFLAIPKPELTKQIAPEVVSHSNHTRMQDDVSSSLGVGGLEAKDVSVQAVHKRVDSPQT